MMGARDIDKLSGRERSIAYASEALLRSIHRYFDRLSAAHRITRSDCAALLLSDGIDPDRAMKTGRPARQDDGRNTPCD